VSLSLNISSGLVYNYRRWRWEKRFETRRSRFSSRVVSKLDPDKLPARFLSFVYSTTNLGDEIQTIAQLGFISRGADIKAIDRELTHEYRGTRRVLVSNGWFLHNTGAWPPSRDIDPIFISMHIAKPDLLTPENIAYFQKHEPIGCRDTHTLRLLQNAGIEAYFSGCLTLTLHNPYGDEERDIPAVICDSHLSEGRDYPPSAPRLLKKLVPEEILRKAIRVEQECSPANLLDYRRKAIMAEGLLDLYARARVVITSRLHCALPCIAMGTPVVFLHRNYDHDTRFDGLREYLNGFGPDNGQPYIDWAHPPKADITQLRALLEQSLTARLTRMRVCETN
jgi:Polysaccharide pyruvyl transferase